MAFPQFSRQTQDSIWGISTLWGLAALNGEGVYRFWTLGICNSSNYISMTQYFTNGDCDEIDRWLLL